MHVQAVFSPEEEHLPADSTMKSSMKSAADYPEGNTFRYGPFMVKFICRVKRSELLSEVLFC